MWKRPENESSEQCATPSCSAAEKGSCDRNASARAVIGASIAVKGEISGAEDLLIEGFIEGTVNLKQNVVTIGKNGRVTANVFGKVVHIEGELNGDCFASDQVIVHKSGSVKGNISAPRVTLEDGARLKGAIDTSSNEATNEISRSSQSSEKAKGATANSSTQKREGPSTPAQI